MNKDRIWTLVGRKLANEASLSELDELGNLLKADPEMANAVYFVLEYWNAPIAQNDISLEASYQMLADKLNQKGFPLHTNVSEDTTFKIESSPKSKKFRLSLFFTVLFCVFFGGAYLFQKFKMEKTSVPSIESEIITKNGSRTKIQLPDGSTVTLNSSSKLTYDNKNFGAKVREVFLTGEAYFDVTKNPSIPFIVHTNNMDVKVLGTAFNVKCYPGERTTETSLIHGSVEVMIKNRNEKLMLKPNEKLVINNSAEQIEGLANSNSSSESQMSTAPIIELSKLSIYPNTNEIVETNWLNNKLTFKNEKLKDIVLKMQRWYNVNIIIQDQKLNNEILTGTFEKESIYQAIKALQVTASFNYSVKNDTIILKY